jgi:NADPH:quinone reductase-like Zn-dependent oxidoreductase
MKALRFSKFGPPSVLRIEEIPRPEPHDGGALVKVKAAAINPSDVKMSQACFQEQHCHELRAAIFQGWSSLGKNRKARKYGAAVRA